MCTDQKCRKGMLKTTLLPNSEQVQQKLETKVSLCKMGTVVVLLNSEQWPRPRSRISRGEGFFFLNKPMRCHSLDMLNQEYHALGHNRVSLDNLELHFRCSWHVPPVNNCLNHSQHLWVRHWTKQLMLFYLHTILRSVWLLFLWVSEQSTICPRPHCFKWQADTNPAGDCGSSQEADCSVPT